MESKKAEINWGTAGSEDPNVTIPKGWFVIALDRLAELTREDRRY